MSVVLLPVNRWSRGGRSAVAFQCGRTDFQGQMMIRAAKSSFTYTGENLVQRHRRKRACGEAKDRPRISFAFWNDFALCGLCAHEWVRACLMPNTKQRDTNHSHRWSFPFQPGSPGRSWWCRCIALSPPSVSCPSVERVRPAPSDPAPCR